MNKRLIFIDEKEQLPLFASTHVRILDVHSR